MTRCLRAKIFQTNTTLHPTTNIYEKLKILSQFIIVFHKIFALGIFHLIYHLPNVDSFHKRNNKRSTIYFSIWFLFTN